MKKTLKSLFVSLLIFTNAQAFGFLSTDKINDLYQQFEPISEEQQSKVGIEIEGFVPRSIGIERVVEETEDFVEASYGNSFREVTKYTPHLGGFEFVKYEVQYYKEDTLMNYSIHPDFSVMPGKEFYPVEIASAILVGENDEAFFGQLIERLKTKGFQSNAHWAGVHFHIDVSGLTMAELNLIGYIWSQIEEDVMEWSQISEDRVVYAGSLDAPIREALEGGTLNSETLEDFLSIKDNRYRMFNLFSLPKLNTLEFRYLNGTTDLEIVFFHKELLKQLVKAVRTKNPKLKQLLLDGEFGLRDLVAALDLDLKTFDELGNRMKSNKEKDRAMQIRFGRRIRSLIDVSIYALKSVFTSEGLKPKPLPGKPKTCFGIFFQDESR